MIGGASRIRDPSARTASSLWSLAHALPSNSLRPCRRPDSSARRRAGARPASRPRRTAAGPAAAALPVRGPRQRRAHRVGRRRAGRYHRLLRRRGVGRRLEVHRRRATASAPSSTTSRCTRSARWPSRRPTRRRVGRHRRGVGHPRQRRHRRRHLQVHRRRRTWTHMGLDETGRIGRIIVHPDQPGHRLCLRARAARPAPQQERGVFRTTDGGQTWDRVLFVDENTGCSGLTMDAHESRRAVRRHVAGGDAHLGRVQRRPRQRRLRVARRRVDVDAGRGRRACRSRRSARSTSPSRRRLRTASTRSSRPPTRDRCGARTTAATTWKVVSWDRTLIGRAGYYIRLGGEPGNADEVLVANSSFHRSTDGGQTFRRASRGAATTTTSGWIRRTPTTWIATDDGGTSITTITAQSYPERHAADRPDVSRGRRQPGAVLDLQQPAGRRHDARAERRGGRATAAGEASTPGRRGGRGGVVDAVGAAAGRRTRWRGAVRRGITASAAASRASRFPTRTDPNIVWATCYGNKVTRYDAATGSRASVSPWIHHARLAAARTRSTAATGRRRSRSIRSITTPSTTAARSSSRPPTPARAGA